MTRFLRYTWARSLATCSLLLLGGCYPEQPDPTSARGDASVLTGTLFPPSSFAIVEGDSTHLHFRWKDESIRETGYVLEMRQDGSDFAVVRTLPADADSTTFLWTFDKRSTYGFRMRTVRNDMSSTPTPTWTMNHHEEYYFLKYYTVGSAIYDGVHRISGGQTTRILSGNAPNAYQFADLAFRGDSLVVIGPFLSVQGEPMTRAAFWNGQRWDRFGEGVPDLAPMVLHPSENGLYVGTRPSRFSASYIYRWNGEVFAPLTTIGLSEAGTVLGGATFDGRTYFALDRARSNTADRLPIAVVAYRGQELQPVQQPDYPYLPHYRQTGIASLPDGLYLSLSRIENPDGHATDTSIVRFNGTAWEVLSILPERQMITSLTSWNDDLFGIRITLDTVGIEVQNEVLRWSGSAWSVFKDESDSFYDLWNTPNGLIAGSTAPGTSQVSLHKWNGRSWSIVGTYADGQSVRVVTAKQAWSWTREQ